MNPIHREKGVYIAGGMVENSYTQFHQSIFFKFAQWGVESKLGPLGTSATEWPILSAPVDYDNGKFVGMQIGRGNRSTRRKPTPAPLCPPQIPLDQTRVWTRAAAVGSQRLTAWAMTRQFHQSYVLPNSRHTEIRWNGIKQHSPYIPSVTSAEIYTLSVKTCK
jgi:hypothetical protein